VTQANANKPAQKHYTRYTLLAVAAATAYSNAKKHGLLTVERQLQLIELSRSARVGLESFFKEQLLAPAVNIINNVLFRKRAALMDAAAIQDARLSLETMLDDFIRDTEKGVSTIYNTYNTIYTIYNTYNTIYTIYTYNIYMQYMHTIYTYITIYLSLYVLCPMLIVSDTCKVSVGMCCSQVQHFAIR
jgi:ATP synthase regulation protein NCA2